MYAFFNRQRLYVCRTDSCQRQDLSVHDGKIHRVTGRGVFRWDAEFGRRLHDPSWTSPQQITNFFHSGIGELGGWFGNPVNIGNTKICAPLTYFDETTNPWFINDVYYVCLRLSDGAFTDVSGSTAIASASLPFTRATARTDFPGFSISRFQPCNQHSVTDNRRQRRAACHLCQWLDHGKFRHRHRIRFHYLKLSILRPSEVLVHGAPEMRSAAR